MLAKTMPYVLYETLGPTLPDGLAGAAGALWGLAQKAFVSYPDAVRRAGHADGNALFEAILSTPSGVTFTVHEYPDDFGLIGDADHRINLDLPEMLDEIRALPDAKTQLTTAQFPIVLAAGERRAYTANDIFRDPGWRRRDADGALRVSVEDATVGPRRRRPSADHHRGRHRRSDGGGQRGDAGRSWPLPNGFGLDYADADGAVQVPGVAPNALTSRTGGTPRRHAMAQARPGADRGGRPRLSVNRECPRLAAVCRDERYLGIPYLLIKISLEGLSVPVLVFARTLIGAAVLLPLALSRTNLGSCADTGSRCWPSPSSRSSRRGCCCPTPSVTSTVRLRDC